MKIVLIEDGARQTQRNVLNKAIESEGRKLKIVVAKRDEDIILAPGDSVMPMFTSNYSCWFMEKVAALMSAPGDHAIYLAEGTAGVAREICLQMKSEGKFVGVGNNWRDIADWFIL